MRGAPSLTWLGWAYALVPLAGALLWMLTGDLDAERNISPLDLTQIVELAILFVAVRAGLGGDFIAGALTRLERRALALLAVVWVLGIVLAAPEPLAAVERTAMRLPHLGAGIGLCFLLGRAGADAAGAFPRFFLWQPLCHLPMLLFLYVVYLDEPRMNWLGGPVGYWHVRVWGMVLAAAAAAAIGLHAGRARGWRSDLTLLVQVSVLATLLAWSGSRASILGLLLSYALALAWVRRPLLRGLAPVVAGAALGLVLSLHLTPPNGKYGLLNTLSESRAADVDASTGGRMTLWRGALELVAERPLIGHGFDQFRYVYTGAPAGTIQPHNAVLQLMVDFGLVGGLAALVLLLSLWWRAVGDLRAPGRGWKLPAVMALNALAVIALFDGALYHPEPLALIAMCFGILLSQRSPR